MMLLTQLMNAPARLQKWAAAALLTFAVALVLSLAASAFALVRSKQSELADLRQKAGRLEQIAKMKSSFEPMSEDAANAGAQSLFLEAESLTIGQANLQSRVEAIAQSNGLLLSSAGGVPDLEENGLKLIGLRVDFSGSYEAVQESVANLETSVPPLIVRELAIRLASGEGGDRPVELAAQITLFGAFRLSGVPESAAAQ